MKWLAALLLALALAGCGGPSAADIARDQAEAQRYDLRAQREAELAPLETRLTAWGLWLAAGLATALVGWAIAGLALDARRRAVEVRALARAVEAGVLPTPDGRLPVPVAALPVASVAALGALHGARQLAVADQPLTSTLTLAGAEAALAGLLEAPADEG